MLPRVNPVCSSSALHELVCVCGTALLPLSSSCARCWPRWAAAVGAAEFEGARTIGRPPLCAFAHSGSSEHRVRGDSVAPPLQRRKSQSVRAGTDAEISTDFSRRRLRQQPCAQAAPSYPRGACGGSMLLGASKQGNKIFRAMSAPVYCDGPKREREHGACNERRAKEAAPHLLRRPHFRSTLFTGLSDSSASRWLDCMRCSVALDVMPHSATSRATGDDTSTIKSWNSGV